MVRHSFDEVDLKDEFLPVDLHLLLLEKQYLSEILPFQVQSHSTLRAYHVVRPDSMKKMLG